MHSSHSWCTQGKLIVSVYSSYNQRVMTSVGWCWASSVLNTNIQKQGDRMECWLRGYTLNHILAPRANVNQGLPNVHVEHSEAIEAKPMRGWRNSLVTGPAGWLSERFSWSVCVCARVCGWLFFFSIESIQKIRYLPIIMHLNIFRNPWVSLYCTSQCNVDSACCVSWAKALR